MSDDVPPVIRAWIGQLLDPAFVAIVRASDAGTVDVRLAAARGRVRLNPTVTVNGGPGEMGDPSGDAPARP